jgi:predicted transcriptional regulator
MAKRTTISLSDAELKQLKELAKVEHRPISRQIIYMMHYYLKQQTEK